MQWTQDVKDRLAARDEAYPNRDYPVYPTDFLAEFDEQSKLCYNITIKAACIFEQTCPDSAKYAMPVYTRFIDKFDQDLAAALSTFETSFKAQSIFDSMALEITREGAAYPEQVMQDADHVKNFDCFTRAVSQAVGQYSQWCDKYENIVYFKLTDYTAQDVNVLAT